MVTNGLDSKNNNKKIKESILIALVLLASCDISHKLLINGDENLHMETPCGNIIVSGRTFASESVKMTFNGRYDIFPDSLNVDVPLWPDIKKEKISILDSNGKELQKTDGQIHIDGKKEIEIRISGSIPMNYAGKSKNGCFKIIPSGFIKCDGENVLTDTIVFRRMLKVK